MAEDTAGNPSPVINLNFTFDTSAFAPGALGGGSFFVTQSGSSLLLNFTPVPEPSTLALLAAGLAMLLGRLRRRKA